VRFLVFFYSEPPGGVGGGGGGYRASANEGAMRMGFVQLCSPMNRILDFHMQLKKHSVCLTNLT
jgi:hypothetical protein